jgi:hypothetical protein
MYLDPHQFSQINVPKKCGQKSLEPYIVKQHLGDKQVSTGNGRQAYLYLNNPVYRIPPNNDPAPGSLSSRTINNPNLNLKPTESALQLLYPRIDSGSVLLDQKNYDQRWNSSRTNIPPMFSPDGKAFANDEFAQERYDAISQRRYDNWDKYQREIRSNPIYDQSRISDEIVPDGIRDITLRHDHLDDVAATCKCKWCQAGLSHPKTGVRPFPDYVNTTEVPSQYVIPLEKRVQNLDFADSDSGYPLRRYESVINPSDIMPKETSVENFNYTRPSDLGHYGYFQPGPYASMEGGMGSGYNVDQQDNNPVVPNFIEIPKGYKSGIHYVKPQYNSEYDVLDAGKTKNDNTDNFNRFRDRDENWDRNSGKEYFIKNPGKNVTENGDISLQYRKVLMIAAIILAIILLSYITYNAMKKSKIEY